ncbi:MAG: hypothetical protein GEV10_15660 [Streptosporangiales bacterium]|nr:hypothetical protein [Streptosporangiales bacterium]
MTEPARASSTVVGVDAGTRGLREADHLVRDLADRLGLPDDTLACTHLIRTEDEPHVALSFGLPPDAGDATAWTTWSDLARADGVGVAAGARRLGPGHRSDAAAEAAARHAAGRSGRAVLYVGVATLTGTVTVGDMLARTAIDAISVLAHPIEPVESDLVETRDHVRPEWRDGVLTLTTTAVARDRYAPFEIPDPTPCCADHD